jgi:HK97 family phage prohead protease
MQIPKTIQNKLDEGRQYRSFEGMEVLAEEDGSMTVEGYASTFDQPYMLFRDGNYEVWEQVDRDAFAEADMEDIILQYDHVGRVFARKSNGTLAVTPDEVGLRIPADLGGTELGRQLYEEIKGGYTTKMSFGFKVAEDAFKKAQVKLVTLTNYEAVVEQALQSGYIKQGDVALLNEWRKDPAHWNG